MGSEPFSAQRQYTWGTFLLIFFLKCVALWRYEKMRVLHVRKKFSHLQLGSQSDEYG